MAAIQPIDNYNSVVIAHSNRILDISDEQYGIIVSRVTMAFSEAYSIEVSISGQPFVVFGTETRPATIDIAAHPINKSFLFDVRDRDNFDAVVHLSVGVEGEEPDPLLRLLSKIDTVGQSEAGNIDAYYPFQMSGVLLFAGYASDTIYDTTGLGSNASGSGITGRFGDSDDIGNYILIESASSTISAINQITTNNKWNGVKLYGYTPTVVSLSSVIPIQFVPRILEWYNQARLSVRTNITQLVWSNISRTVYPIALSVTLSSNADAASINLTCLSTDAYIVGNKMAQTGTA